MTIFLFTTKGLTVEGYTPPETSSYYASHAEELAEELRENMFPLLDVEWADARVQDGKIVVTAGEDDLNTVRLSVIHYYDKKLFKFTEREAS